jgi:diamine N-acetyltransferase
LIIDRRHQRRGIAIAALRQLIDDLRAQGCSRLLVSYVLAPGGPEPLYRGLGFVPTGEMDEDETVAALTL